MVESFFRKYPNSTANLQMSAQNQDFNEDDRIPLVDITS